MKATPDSSDVVPMSVQTSVHDIAVRDGNVRIETAGFGMPLILLHGWSLNRTVWRAQMEALSPRFMVIAVDRRGFGGSSAPPNLAEESTDLVAILDRLNLDRAAVIGMSQAGRVALRFALDHSDRIAGLGLQGAPLDGFHPEPRGEDIIPVAHYAAMVRDGQLDLMKAQWREHPLMQSHDAPTRRLIDGLLADYEARDLLSPARPLPAIATDLHAIEAPALVITGAHDTPWRQLAGDALAYGLPNACRTTIPHGGHLCNVTHPSTYNDLVARFVDGITPHPDS